MHRAAPDLSVGSPPFHQVESPPPWELPPFSAYVVWPLFFSTAVTKAELLPGLGFEPLPPWNMPFSMSASIHGPEPWHGAKKQVVAMLTASMCPLPVS
jgi:hypothetical protein